MLTMSEPKRFSYCVVWSPIPFVTWILPFIGHLGICDSDGIILDFAGPYNVGVGHFAFGNPTRYVKLDPNNTPTEMRANKPLDEWWDENLERAATFYRQRMYGFFTDNCHCFVAKVLNDVRYDGSGRWDMVKLASLAFIRGKYVGMGGFVKTWLPFAILVALGGYFGRLTFLYTYLGVLAFFTMFFLMCAYVCRPLFVVTEKNEALEYV
ncbi:hypothetical protein BSKO_07188 [Bryopsis sp. KO-2023]|nr:hypothetical protein BSKO_07188 [Bryopsis sp. KO-2023]